MVFNINQKDAPKGQLRGDRGDILQLVNAGIGSRQMDFHINVLKPGTGPGPYHYHSNAENLYFVLEGRAKVTVEGREMVAGPGETVLIMPGEKHDVENVGEGELRVIEVKSPPDSDFITVDRPEPGRHPGAAGSA